MEKGAHHAHAAHGHTTHARHHADEAAKHHADEHGGSKKSTQYLQMNWPRRNDPAGLVVFTDWRAAPLSAKRHRVRQEPSEPRSGERGANATLAT